MAKTKTSPALSTDALKPYVQRAMTDPELREDLLAAFVAAREPLRPDGEGPGVKGKAEKVSEKDFQKQLQTSSATCRRRRTSSRARRRRRATRRGTGSSCSPA